MTALEQAIDTLSACTGLNIKATGSKKVTEPGVYIYLKKIKPFVRNKDSVVLQILIASAELTGGEDAIIPRLYAIRSKVRAAEGQFNGMDIFRKTRSLKPFNGLLRYVITFETEIYNEVLNEEVYV
jgi:hypothetical protein